jgi:hypothetical protein
MMRRIGLARSRTLAAGLALGLLVSTACPSVPAAQRSGASPPTIGILPFVDATRSTATVNAAVSQALRGELVHSTSLGARVIGTDAGVRPQSLDGPRAVALGRAEQVDYVLLGSILEASAERRQQGGRLPRIRGQSATAQVRAVSASVSIQVELYGVATGERIGSFRVSGRHSDAQLGGTLYTSFGQLQSSGTTFMESPLGRAFHKAMAELTQKIVGLELT